MQEEKTRRPGGISLFLALSSSCLLTQSTYTSTSVHKSSSLFASFKNIYNFE